MDLFIITDTFDIKNYNVYIYEKCTNTDDKKYNFFYDDNNDIIKNKKIKQSISQKTYNKKKEHYKNQINKVANYYQCIFNSNIVIVKFNVNCFAFISKNNKNIRFFNDFNLFKNWFLESGYFSNNSGCSCDMCVELAIEKYLSEYEINNNETINLTKNNILSNLDIFNDKN